MRKKKRFQTLFIHSLKGSSTIEASLLMPIILTLLFLLIYLSVFLYVRAGSVRLGYVAALRASQMEQETKKAKEILAKKEFHHLKEENYMGSALCDGNVTAKGDTIKMTVRVKQSLPGILFAGGKLYGDVFLDESIYEAKTCHPVDFIRKCRKIQKGVERWKQ